VNNKFFDLEPHNGSIYLCENGVRIARYNDWKSAEATRELFMQAEATRLQRAIDELY
jgi:hypothetical protein